MSAPSGTARMLRSVRSLVAGEAAAGVLLIAVATLALALANSPLAGATARRMSLRRRAAQ